MKYKKVVPTWNPKKAGDQVEGIIIAIQEEGGKFQTRIYTLETETEVIDVFGSKVLDEKIKNICHPEETVKIVFLGRKQGKEAEYKDYDVYLVCED